MNEVRKATGLTTEQFFYFFLRLRKGEIRRIVKIAQERYPDESPEKIARRIINSHASLTLLGGGLLSVPLLIPTLGQALKLAGVVGSTSLLTRMHLYMIMEIAAAFGKDIDDPARVPEMMAVAAATGLGAASPMLVDVFGLHPFTAIPIGGLSMSTVTQLIGTTALLLYRRQAQSSHAVSGQAVSVAA